MTVATGERRRVARELVSGIGMVHWAGKSMSVTIRNVTGEGLQFEAATAVPDATVVRLSGRNIECQGITRYSRQVNDRYLVGVELLRAPYSRNDRDYKED